ncbi:MAG: hypothetical protein JST28_09060 [Acidobacteria bacterium]|nr:hypothetical protein [Acidobacteriota bacterium]
MPASIIEFSDTTPSASAGKINVKWQNDGGSPTVNVSAEVDDAIVEYVTFTGVNGTLANTPRKIIAALRNGLGMQTTDNTRTDYYSMSGAAATLATAAGGSDVFTFIYYKN